ncbi:MAG: hypothetical protein KC493_04715 [Bacteriovoracaceae bacterium]|nr:hypothetical protein [Bacteriovoracaceae bacterium]
MKKLSSFIFLLVLVIGSTNAFAEGENDHTDCDASSQISRANQESAPVASGDVESNNGTTASGR